MDNQFEYWDRVAEGKTFTHPLDRERVRARIPLHGRILDYGCGYGRTCDELVRMGYGRVLGVDTSAEMIQRGRLLFPHLFLRHLALSGAGQLPLNDSDFDAVVLFAVLTCMATDAGQRALMDEIHRILRPGGILYISDYWLQEDERNLGRYRRFAGRFDAYGIFRLPEGAVVRHHSRAYINTLLGRFKTLERVDIDVVTMNGNRSKGFQYFGRKKG